MLFTEPIVASFSFYMAFVLGELYIMIAGIPYIFSTAYGYGIARQGLVFFGFAIGFVLAAATVILFARHKQRKARSTKPKPKPEARLQLALVGSVAPPVATIWLGWSAELSALWIVPILAMVFISWSIFLLFVSVVWPLTQVAAFVLIQIQMPSSLYVVDCYGPRYAASAIAATRIAGYSAG